MFRKNWVPRQGSLVKVTAVWKGYYKKSILSTLIRDFTYQVAEWSVSLKTFPFQPTSRVGGSQIHRSQEYMPFDNFESNPTLHCFCLPLWLVSCRHRAFTQSPKFYFSLWLALLDFSLLPIFYFPLLSFRKSALQKIINYCSGIFI